MQIVIILAHPQPGSFNHAIAHTAAEQVRANGYTVVMRDLYQEGFDPVLPGGEITREAILPPAILKGWIDRVIRPGVAYAFVEGDSGEGVPVGLLKAQAALVFNTANTEPERERTVFGDPLETIWKNCIFGLCGVKRFHRQTFGVVVTSSEAQRATWLAETSAIVDAYFPMTTAA